MPERAFAELAIWEKRLIREWRVLQAGLKKRTFPAKSSEGRTRTAASHPSAKHLLSPQEHSPLNRQEQEQAAADLFTLQRGLTGDRVLIGSAYMEEVRRLGAYLLFYWFTSYAQTRGMLDMAYQTGPVQNACNLVPADGTADGSSVASLAIFYQDMTFSGDLFRILDLGSGPAPCSLAAADWLKFRGIPGDNIEITACDQSPLALMCAQSLAQGAGYNIKTNALWRAGASAIPDGKYKIILIGHMLNELWKEDSDRIQKRETFIAELGDHLDPGGILIILEPALLVTGRDLLALRDRLVTSGWRVLAPCFTQRPCPALKESQQTCHSDFAWDLPRTMRELSRRTGLDKDLVKTTALVLSCASGHFERHPGGRPEGCPKGRSGGQPQDRPGELDTAQSINNAAGEVTQHGPYRIVSEPMLNKAGRTRLILCGDEGRIPFSTKLGEGLPGEAVFKKLRRSDAILIYQPVQRETGLALGKETEITVV